MNKIIAASAVAAVLIIGLLYLEGILGNAVDATEQRVHITQDSLAASGRELENTEQGIMQNLQIEKERNNNENNIF